MDEPRHSNHRHQEWVRQEHLSDIHFNLDQLKELRAMYRRQALNPVAAEIISSMIISVLQELEMLKDEYKKRFVSSSA